MTKNTLMESLNDLLRNRLTAINQFFLHARMLKHSGDFDLADYEYKISIDAMRQADQLVERILNLGGQPHLQELDKLMIGHTVDEMLQADLALVGMAHWQINRLLGEQQLKEVDQTLQLLDGIQSSLRDHADSILTRTQKPAERNSKMGQKSA